MFNMYKIVGWAMLFINLISCTMINPQPTRAAVALVIGNGNKYYL